MTTDPATYLKSIYTDLTFQEIALQVLGSIEEQFVVVPKVVDRFTIHMPEMVCSRSGGITYVGRELEIAGKIIRVGDSRRRVRRSGGS